MAQTAVTNHTVGTHQILFSNDENLRPIVAPIVKATFDISLAGQLRFSKNQLPINLEGEFYGAPQSGSYKYEPEVAFIKPKTDVVILADAISHQGPVNILPVLLKVGQSEKHLHVFGDRYWYIDRMSYVISSPEPFTTIPIIYENAYGGWDRRHTDSRHHGFEARNTCGRGYFNKKGGKLNEKLYLPNIEFSQDLISDIEFQPQPAGCGFTLPHWQPRAQLAGTFDSQWQKSRSPLLPKDFDRLFYNAASEGFVFDQADVMNQPVLLENVTPNGQLAFNLPKIRPPVCEIHLKSRTELLTLNLDTVIINVREMKLIYIWRNYLELSRGPHDCEHIDIHNG